MTGLFTSCFLFSDSHLLPLVGDTGGGGEMGKGKESPQRRWETLDEVGDMGGGGRYGRRWEIWEELAYMGGG